MGCQTQPYSISQNDPIASEIRHIRTRVVIQKDLWGRQLDIGHIRQDFDKTEILFRDLNVRFDIDKVEVWEYNQNVSIQGGRSAAAMYPEYLTVYFWQMYSDAGQVVNFFTGTVIMLSGMSSFPWEMQPHGIFVFENHSNPYTLAHEIGHYLGLYHTFQKSGDGVNDTHDTDDPLYCNLMNYHECDDKVTITKGQIDRMRYHLINYRKSIIK